jgi:hypothetical protein
MMPTLMAAAATSAPPTATLRSTLLPTFTPRPTHGPSPTATVAPTLPTPTETPVPTRVPPSPIPTADNRGVVATSLPPARAGRDGPRSYETTVTLPTFDVAAGFIATQPGDSIYPYPRLDFARVGAATPRTYRALVLENDYVALTVLPELGGRIYRWVDKATGRNLLYESPAIMPARGGYRDWWLAAGGMAWVFPVDEHGLVEWHPWQASAGETVHGLSIRVRDVDEHTGMEVGVTVSLDAQHAYMVVQPWVRNITATAHPYQFWLNAMLALGDNTVSPETRLILPANQILVRAGMDAAVARSGSPLPWPFYEERDMSRYGNWGGTFGFFAPDVAHGFSGVYDPAADQGIVRAYSPGWPAGTGVFGPETLDAPLVSNKDAHYIALWSGATSTTWRSAILNPGETFSWTEYWYPVHGLGGFDHANRNAALRLTTTAKGAQLGVSTSSALDGILLLYAGGREVVRLPLSLDANQPFRATWQRPAGMSGPLGLRLFALDGTIVAQTGVFE